MDQMVMTGMRMVNLINFSFLIEQQFRLIAFNCDYFVEFIGVDSDDSEAEEIDIDNMLDEGLPEDLRERKQMYQYEEKSKLVLEGK